jgi:hypothetical protein
MNSVKERSKSKQDKWAVRTPYFEAVARLYCYRQAGHVVVAHALGWPVLSVAAGRGVTQVHFQPPGILDQATLKSAMKVFTAGTVAATIHQKAAEAQGFASGQESRGYGAYWHIPLSIQAEGKFPCDEPTSDYAIVLKTAGMLCPAEPDNKQMLAEIVRGEQEAKALLRRHWQAVADIATALHQSPTGRLEHDQVLELLQRHFEPMPSKTRKHSRQGKAKNQAQPAGVGNLTVLADWAREKLFPAHRGAFIEEDRLIVFDNGGVGHPWGVHELELALVWLREHDYTVEGLACCSDCHTWVVVAEARPDTNLEALTDMLWQAWRQVVGAEGEPRFEMYKAVQSMKALETILDRPRLPSRVKQQLSQKSRAAA